MKQPTATQANCSEEVLKVRIEGVSEAQRRSRAAFLASTIISLAIIIACYNAYVSWYRVFAIQEKWPTNEVTKEAQRYVTEEWVKSLKISIPVLGINVGIGDAVVLGSLSLLITSIWLFFSVRRENHTIGLLLQETQGCPAAVLNRVFHGVISYSVFTTVTKVDAPIRTLDMAQNRKGSVRFVRSAFKLLVFLPTIAIFFVIFMDILSIFYLPAPLRYPHISLLELSDTISIGDWVHIALMETWGVAMFLLTTILCAFAIRYNSGTEKVLREYEDLMDENALSGA